MAQTLCLWIIHASWVSSRQRFMTLCWLSVRMFVASEAALFVADWHRCATIRDELSHRFRHHNGAGECANSCQMEHHQAAAGCEFVVSERYCVQICRFSRQRRYSSSHWNRGFGFITACHWLQKYQQDYCLFYSPYGNITEMTEDKCRFCLKENETFQQSKLEQT